MSKAEVNGTTIAYEVNGQGDLPILLLPGLATARGYFQFFEPLLRDHFTTILVDPRGLGESPSDDTEYTAETWADDFAALIDHLGLGRVHVLGSSHGGCMALAMAHRYPDKITSMVIAGGFSELNRLMEINLRLRLNLVSQLGMGTEIADHVTMWTNRPDFLDTEQGQRAVEANTKSIMAADPDRYMAMVRSMQHWGRVLESQQDEPSFTAHLPEIQHPTLALTGDSDHYIPAGLSKLMAEQMPNGEYLEIAQCGHIAVQERPDAVADAVTEFVRRHAKVGTSPTPVAS